MAKAIITTENKMTIHGITRPMEGNLLFFCDKLNSGNLVAEYVDEAKDTHFASGLLCLLYNGTELRPFLLQYRSIWGTSTKAIEYKDSVLSKTPQTSHNGTSVLFSNGSAAINSDLKGKSLIVEKSYNGTFVSKKDDKEYTWELLGLGINDTSYAIKGDVLTIGANKFSLKELQKGFDAIEAAQNERLSKL